MDGGQVLRAVVWGVTGNRDRATAIAAMIGQLVGAAAVALGIWLFVHQGVDRAVPRSFYAAWLIIVGTFIFSGARQARAQSAARRALAEGTAEQAMSPLGPSMPEDISLSESLDRYLRDHPGGLVPVVDGWGNLVGVLTFESARRVGARDPLRPIREAMIRPADMATVQADEHLDRVADQVGGGEPAVVLRDGEAVGAISAADLGRWLGSRIRR
jgi:hypothetical protein